VLFLFLFFFFKNDNFSNEAHSSFIGATVDGSIVTFVPLSYNTKIPASVLSSPSSSSSIRPSSNSLAKADPQDGGVGISSLPLAVLAQALEHRMVGLAGNHAIGALSHSEWRSAYNAYTGMSMPPPAYKHSYRSSAFSTSLSHSFSHPGFVDGDMVELFMELTTKQKKEIVKNLMEIDLFEYFNTYTLLKNPKKDDLGLDLVMRGVEKLTEFHF
jgi:hypothetical protein